MILGYDRAAMALYVREGPSGGKGVFTDGPIPAGGHIIRFTGPFLSYAETTPWTYALQCGADLYIGASGSFDDYINHSCEPNAGVRVEGDVRRPESLRVSLYAVRNIAAGEEVVFDYSTVMAEDDFEFDCRCGSPACRGRIRDGKHLSDAVWARYLAMGIVPAYVVESRSTRPVV
jgi:hypothetical protein